MLGRRGWLWVALLVATMMIFGACKEHKKGVTDEQDTGDLTPIVNENRSTTDAADDDDATDDDAADDDAADDDAADDDAADDDAADDDDTTDDWQQDDGGPVLSGGTWDPAEISTTDAVSTFAVSVCDEEDNLSGGQLFILNAGSTDNFLADETPWDGFSGLGDVSDCGAPAEVTIQVNFAGASVGEYCADIRATDGDGLRSNVIEDVCVNLVP
ncbi:MAG: hypothetical protein IT350_16360 [Deltaproteobacteria bacterium]|nr:hypothetical protein [Deltaproteobacteria bacterium]